jgi:hypothetical protein
MEILLSSKIGGSLYTNRWITTFLMIDEAANAVGRGWTIAGVQRLFAQTDTSVLILEGNGSAVYFDWQGGVPPNQFFSPNGEFSQLTQFQQPDELGTGLPRLHQGDL